MILAPAGVEGTKGMISTAIWAYVYACFGAGGNVDLRLYIFDARQRFEGDMDLRVCMFQRLRSYGLTIMHV